MFECFKLNGTHRAFKRNLVFWAPIISVKRILQEEEDKCVKCDNMKTDPYISKPRPLPVCKSRPLPVSKPRPPPVCQPRPLPVSKPRPLSNYKPRPLRVSNHTTFVPRNRSQLRADEPATNSIRVWNTDTPILHSQLSLLKESSTQHGGFLMRLLQHLLDSVCPPNQWKESTITPVPKAPELEDSRPAALLPSNTPSDELDPLHWDF